MPRVVVAPPDLAGALWWGNGALGDVTLAVVNTTLTADAYYRSLVIPAGMKLHCAGYRLFVAEQLIVLGQIDNNGHAAVAAVAGAGGAAGSVGGGTAGAAGGLGAGGAGGNQINAITVGSGGAGGASGATLGGAGGTVTPPGATQTSPQDFLGSFYGLTAGAAITPFLGGAGGGAGAGDGANDGGAGGGGAGIVLISARLLVVGAGGSIQANGGNGGNATAGNAGGGGGGGGGAIIINTTTGGLLTLPNGVVGIPGVVLTNSQLSFGEGTLQLGAGMSGNGHGTGANGVHGNSPLYTDATIGESTFFYNVLPL